MFSLLGKRIRQRTKAKRCDSGTVEEQERRERRFGSEMLGTISFWGRRFQRIGCGKPPVPVRLAAQCTRMQFARFPNRGTTRGTRNSNELLRSKFSGFHKLLLTSLSKIRAGIICSILLIQQIRGELTSRKVSHSSCCSAADLACL
jgi:hypothetical protein